MPYLKKMFFRPRFCTVRLHWDRDNLTSEMNYNRISCHFDNGIWICSKPSSQEFAMVVDYPWEWESTTVISSCCFRWSQVCVRQTKTLTVKPLVAVSIPESNVAASANSLLVSWSNQYCRNIHNGNALNRCKKIKSLSTAIIKLHTFYR